VPVSRMWTLKVMRSTIAAIRRGLGNTAPVSAVHSPLSGMVTFIQVPLPG
jgi:hypothetical protein